ncbi:phylloplanin-like [Primulina eburnea]|uniref:phylloplanin-like n=1 Tax=Primulina eburnea TaxID=1245227 RepID=UPI003C6C3072
MAIKNVLIFLLFAILATSFADAQSTIGVTHVNGPLYCTTKGNITAGPGASALYCTTNGNITTGPNASATPVFPNAAWQVACSADVVVLARVNGKTNSNGSYLVVLIPRSNATVNSIVSNCRLFVLTPLSRCNTVLPAPGLVSILRFVKTVYGFLPLTCMVPPGFALQS